MVNVRASKPHPGASFGLNDSYVGTGKRRRELNCRGWTDSAHARYLTGGDLNLDTTSFIYQDGLHWRGRRTALRANVSPFPYLMPGVFCGLRCFFFFFFFYMYSPASPKYSPVLLLFSALQWEAVSGTSTS